MELCFIHALFLIHSTQQITFGIGRSVKRWYYLVMELLSTGQKSEIDELAKRQRLKFIVLFGSRAGGRGLRPDSDYDLAIYREQSGRLFDDFQAYGEILDALADCFKVKEDQIDLTDLRTDIIIR